MLTTKHCSINYLVITTKHCMIRLKCFFLLFLKPLSLSQYIHYVFLCVGRQSVKLNTTVQGSAADLVKLAMVNIDSCRSFIHLLCFFIVCEQAERQAVNTTVQGSAADLVKLAMVRIDEELMKVYPDTTKAHRHKFTGECL